VNAENWWEAATVTAIIVPGLVTMIWRLGRLAQKVDDMAERLTQLEAAVNGGGRKRPGPPDTRNRGR
jgi:hypothetical protein